MVVGDVCTVTIAMVCAEPRSILYHWPGIWSAPVYHFVAGLPSMPPGTVPPAPVDEAVAVHPVRLIETGVKVDRPPAYFMMVATMRSFWVNVLVAKRCSFSTNVAELSELITGTGA